MFRNNVIDFILQITCRVKQDDGGYLWGRDYVPRPHWDRMSHCEAWSRPGGVQNTERRPFYQLQRCKCSPFMTGILSRSRRQLGLNNRVTGKVYQEGLQLRVFPAVVNARDSFKKWCWRGNLHNYSHAGNWGRVEPSIVILIFYIAD